MEIWQLATVIFMVFFYGAVLAASWSRDRMWWMLWALVWLAIACYGLADALIRLIGGGG